MRISDWSSDVGSSDRGGQRLGIVLRGVQHHFHDALDVAICFDQTADVHAETAGDGGAHLLPVQYLAFNLAGFDNVLGECLKHGFRAQREAKRLHVTNQTPLPVAHGGKRSEEHTSELQSLMRTSYAVFCLQKKKKHQIKETQIPTTN